MSGVIMGVWLLLVLFQFNSVHSTHSDCCPSMDIYGDISCNNNYSFTAYPRDYSYRFYLNLSVTQSITIDTCRSTFDTVIEVYKVFGSRSNDSCYYFIDEADDDGSCKYYHDNERFTLYDLYPGDYAIEISAYRPYDNCNCNPPDFATLSLNITGCDIDTLEPTISPTYVATDSPTTYQPTMAITTNAPSVSPTVQKPTSSPVQGSNLNMLTSTFIPSSAPSIDPTKSTPFQSPSTTASASETNVPSAASIAYTTESTISDSASSTTDISASMEQATDSRTIMEFDAEKESNPSGQITVEQAVMYFIIFIATFLVLCCILIGVLLKILKKVRKRRPKFSDEINSNPADPAGDIKQEPADVSSEEPVDSMINNKDIIQHIVVEDDVNKIDINDKLKLEIFNSGMSDNEQLYNDNIKEKNETAPTKDNGENARLSLAALVSLPSPQSRIEGEAVGNNQFENDGNVHGVMRSKESIAT